MYPFELVTLLLKAVRENQKLQMVSNTHAMSIAIMHSLDAAFNKGKANILSRWTEAISEGLIKSNEPVKQIVSERTLAFFESLPKFTKEET